MLNARKNIVRSLSPLALLLSAMALTPVAAFADDQPTTPPSNPDQKPKRGPGGAGRPEGGRPEGARPERKLNDFQKTFDANNDGKLDETERAKMQEAVKTRVAKIKTEIDTNKDGKLSQDEWKAYLPAVAEARAERRKNFDEAKEKAKEALLRRFDKNNDGKLDDAEKDAALEQMDENNLRMIAEHNASGDGKLSAADKTKIAEALKEMKDRRENGGGPGGPGGEGRRPGRGGGPGGPGGGGEAPPEKK